MTLPTPQAKKKCIYGSKSMTYASLKDIIDNMTKEQLNSPVVIENELDEDYFVVEKIVIVKKSDKNEILTVDQPVLIPK
jgi:hypothetical protein